MATQTRYTFTIDQVDSQVLISLIRSSSISTALDYINTDGSLVSIYFKDVLSDPDSSTLVSLMTSYVYVTPVLSNLPLNVITQFESTKFTLKLACASGNVESDGTVTILLKIPGIPGGSDGRWINAAEAFFDVPTPGDRVLGAWFVDVDNISGEGENTTIGSYTDDALSLENQGWFLPSTRGFVKVETVGFYGFAPSGFYIKVIGKKGGGVNTGTLYVNFEWATEGT